MKTDGLVYKDGNVITTAMKGFLKWKKRLSVYTVELPGPITLEALDYSEFTKAIEKLGYKLKPDMIWAKSETDWVMRTEDKQFLAHKQEDGRWNLIQFLDSVAIDTWHSQSFESCKTTANICSRSQ